MKNKVYPWVNRYRCECYCRKVAIGTSPLPVDGGWLAAGETDTNGVTSYYDSKHRLYTFDANGDIKRGDK